MVTEKTIQSLVEAITPSPEEKRTHTYSATVSKIDNEGVIWVCIAGGSKETPTASTSAEVKQGDTVNVEWRNNKLYIAGNYSDPASGVSRVGAVETQTTELQKFVVKEFAADRAVIKDLEADTAKIHDLTADQLTATVGYIEDLTAEEITAEDISAATGYIGTLQANNITAQNITADHATVNSLSTNYAHITNGKIDNATIDDAKVNNLSTNYAHITSGVIDNAKIDHADVNNLSANYAHITNGVIDNATIGYADVNNLSAHYAEITNGHINSALINTADIVDEQVFTISGNKATIEEINAAKINVTNLNAKNLTIETADGYITLGNKKTPTKEFIDSLTDELNDRIDGAIETWTSTAVPTLSNYPANQWSTADDRAKHVGDVCYVVNDQITQNGYCYRFTLNGSTFSWQLIKDSDVTAALARLQTAEGKIGDIEAFDEDIASFKTDTEEELSSLKTRTTNVETSLGDKVSTSTFNQLSQTVDENSATITTYKEMAVTTPDGSTTTGINNIVNKVNQTATENKSSISSLSLEVAGQYATSNTAEGTAAKAATIIPSLSNWALYNGATIAVKFINKNTAANPTLNINSTGAKAIKNYSGGNLTEEEYKWTAGSTFSFTYDGANWRMNDSTVATRLVSAETSIDQNAESIRLEAKRRESATNILWDTDVPSLTKVNGDSNRYFSDSGHSQITCSIVEISDAPETGLNYAYRAVCDGSYAGERARALAFYSAADTTSLPLKVGTKYTATWWARCTSGTGGTMIMYRYKGTSNKYPMGSVSENTNNLTSEWKHFTCTVELESMPTDYNRIWFYACFPASTAGTVELCGFRLVAGDNVESYSSTIEQTADRISMVVDGTSASSSLVLTDEAIEAVTDKLVIKGSDGAVVISDGKITAGSLAIGNFDTTTQDMIENGDSALTKINYYSRSCQVGNSSNTQTKYWRKFASLTTTSTNYDPYIIFDVMQAGDFTATKRFGRLKAHFRTGGSKGSIDASQTQLEWITRSEGFTLTDFVLAYKATSGTDVKVELWCECAGNWGGFRFSMVEEGNRTSVATSALWTLYNDYTAEGQAAPTSGYTQVVSTDIDSARLSAENYIYADSSGIRIASANPSTQNQRMELTSDALRMYDSNGQQRLDLTAGGGVKVGRSDKGHTVVTDDGLTIYDGSSTPAKALETTTNGVILYKAGSKRAAVTANGLDIFGSDGSTSIASFGSSVRVGAESAAHTNISDDGMQTYSSGGTLIANLGYGEGYNLAGNLVDAPFYSLGWRRSTSAVGNYSSAEGADLTASGYCSHAEGYTSQARGVASHAEGDGTIADGKSSHAEGDHCYAYTKGAHAGGFFTIADRLQTVIGRYNARDNTADYSSSYPSSWGTTIGEYAFIIGNGESETTRSNALAVDWSGDILLGFDNNAGVGSKDGQLGALFDALGWDSDTTLIVD